MFIFGKDLFFSLILFRCLFHVFFHLFRSPIHPVSFLQLLLLLVMLLYVCCYNWATHSRIPQQNNNDDKNFKQKQATIQKIYILWRERESWKLYISSIMTLFYHFFNYIIIFSLPLFDILRFGRFFWKKIEFEEWNNLKNFLFSLAWKLMHTNTHSLIH